MVAQFIDSRITIVERISIKNVFGITIFLNIRLLAFYIEIFHQYNFSITLKVGHKVLRMSYKQFEKDKATTIKIVRHFATLFQNSFIQLL